MLIPSIDLMNGKAVQLRQGNEKNKIVERDDVVALAKEFSKYGEIAVIDLDAALDKGDNLALIKQLCKIADCRVGGGIRTKEKADEILSAGAKKIIIGTKATPDFLQQFSKERLIVALDAKDNTVVTEGWTKKTTKTPQEIIKELESYCSEFLYTNVNKEGLLEGIELSKIKEIRNATTNAITIAGGVTTIEDIKTIEALECNVQIGMAIYTGKINLPEVFISLLDFQKNNGLLPTIVQDKNKQVLMLAFSNKESLLQTFNTGNTVYYSRSRKKLWQKGETSGNFQSIIKVRYDCDKDSLLFTVQQKNTACHLNQYSCFEDKEFTFDELYQVIVDRINNPCIGSYTSKIATNEASIKEKIWEEAYEVIHYTDQQNLIWEIADLSYFVMLLMAKNGITLNDVKNELWRRRICK